MKTIESKMHGNLPVTLISNNEMTQFNVSINYKSSRKKFTWYHFPNMVEESKAREAYKSYSD